MILFLGTVSFLTGGLHIVLVVLSGGHSFLDMIIQIYTCMYIVRMIIGT